MAIERGPRDVKWFNIADANWEKNEFGVNVLVLSHDERSGALTILLDTPAGLKYPEEAHFYCCDQDLFQLEGEFHHDEELPFHQGDYVYRPPGTVYGNSVGSDGGMIIASLNDRPVRYHFQDHPQPWTGEYLVDQAWNVRSVKPLFVQSEQLSWEPCDFAPDIAIKKLRGEPGKVSEHFGARAHSPWAADWVFMMCLGKGFDGELPQWPDTQLEVFVTGGTAEINAQPCGKGSYTFGHFKGRCQVHEELSLYIRAFHVPAS